MPRTCDNRPEHVMRAIQALADRLREKAKGGTLFGWPMDPGSADDQIVAAYFAGAVEARGDLDRLIELGR